MKTFYAMLVVVSLFAVGALGHGLSDVAAVATSAASGGRSMAVADLPYALPDHEAPVASILVGETAEEGCPVTFLDASEDVDGEVVAWLWSFGDGSFSTQANPSHVYDDAGAYTVSLIAVDDCGNESATASETLLVTNATPLAEFSVGSQLLQVGTALMLYDLSIDPSVNGGIIHVAWDYGDGSYDAGGPDPAATYSHTYELPGEYTITLYVVDEDGGLSWTQQRVVVSG